MKRHRDNNTTTTHHHPIQRRIRNNPNWFNVRLLFVILHVVGANTNSSQNPSSSSNHPSLSPSNIPSLSPSNIPSLSLSNIPSLSLLPSVSKSTDPSNAQSSSPSSPSSSSPSSSSTTPTIPPVTRLTPITTPPTASPQTTTTPPQNLSPRIVRPPVKGISMELSGIAPLSPDQIELYEQLTKEHIEWYFNDSTADGGGGGSSRNNVDGLLEVLSDVEVTITVVGIDPEYEPPVLEKGLGETDEGDVDVDARDNDIFVGDGNDTGKEGGATSQSNGTRTKDVLNLRRSLTLPHPHTIDIGGNNRKRKLEDGILTVTYQQTTSYRLINNGAGLNINNDDEEDELDESIVKEPFDNISKRIRYNDYLKNDGEGVFTNLQYTTLPKVQKEDDGTGRPKETKLDVLAIVVSVLGGIGVFFVMGIIYLKFMRKPPKRPAHPISLPDLPDTHTLETYGNGGILSPESIADYPGHDPSVATIDEDYENRFPGTVSSSGGTVGSTARQSRYSGADSILTPGNLTTGTQSIYTNDDASFEAHLRGPGQPITRDDIFDVIAPPGKLGVVIDTPNSGAPVVYNIKENCPIADQLRVGDKVIFVDDEDVRSMTAVKVSRLISQKSANPTRKFTIMRTIDT